MAEGNESNHNISILYSCESASSLADMKAKFITFVGKFPDNSSVSFTFANSFSDTVVKNTGTGTYILHKINNNYWWGFGFLAGKIYSFTYDPNGFRLSRFDYTDTETI